MTSVSYYQTKSRATERRDRIKSDMDRSSSYIIGTGLGIQDSVKKQSHYDTLKRDYKSSSVTLSRNSSINSYDVGRSRTRTRDHSTDLSMKPRRSTSMDISAPMRPRMRDRSADFSINGIERLATRPKAVIIDTKYEAKPLREMNVEINNTEGYLALQKYKDFDKTKEIDGVIEEERRRSKAYNKIINQASSYQQELDASRATMSNIYMNTDGFSAKTVAAIAKEVVYKEDKGPKNYSWRKDMENYEDTLEKMNAHKQTVRKATEVTRGVTDFKDTNSKIRNYERESRRNIDSEDVTIEVKPYKPTERSQVESTPYKPVEVPSYKANESTPYKPKETNSYTSSVTNGYHNESDTPRQKGSWRKDIEKYEDELKIKQVQKENQRKIQSYESPKAPSETQSSTKSITNVNSQITRASNIPSTTATHLTNQENKPKSDTTSSWSRKTEASITKKEVNTVPRWKKAEETAVENAKTYEVKTKPKSSEPEKEEESKPVPRWKKPVEEPKLPQWNQNKIEETKSEEKKEEESKPVPKWNKPEQSKKEETKVEESKPSPKWGKKIESVKLEETKSLETKPSPKWEKPETTKKDEPKPPETKPVPKWKKATTQKKEEPKAEETKPVETKPAPKWKKPEAVKKDDPKPAETEVKEKTPIKVVVEEAKPETKPTPKWKKPDASKKEETKAEVKGKVEETKAVEQKSVPKWKKPETVKKDEPKPPETKPIPKWKKATTEKKEEPKAEETKPVEAKPTPKWKKPEAVKKDDPKPAEIKPAPKWKKSETSKKDEVKPAEEKPAPKWGKKPEPVKVEEPNPSEAKPTPKWKKPNSAKKEETKEIETKAEPAVGPSKPEEIKEIPAEKQAPLEEKVTEEKPKDVAKEESNKEGEEKPKEGEEEEDEHGVKAMRKEVGSMFDNMEQEFAEGRSKLSALRARIRAAREKAKASAEADAAADAAAEAAREAKKVAAKG